jgi:hypothetical protein
MVKKTALTYFDSLIWVENDFTKTDNLHYYFLICRITNKTQHIDFEGKKKEVYHVLEKLSVCFFD